jgi:hypothetical protein
LPDIASATGPKAVSREGSPMDSIETDLLARNPWVSRRPITVSEYHRMAEVGILYEDDRVELIEGHLIAMSPIGTEHAGAVNWLNRALVLAVGDAGIVSVQNPVRLSDRTEPQTDFTVLKPRPDDYRKAPARPEDVLLLIEIADSSLKYDRAVKRRFMEVTGSRSFGSWTLAVERWKFAQRRPTEATRRSPGSVVEKRSCRPCCLVWPFLSRLCLDSETASLGR